MVREKLFYTPVIYFYDVLSAKTTAVGVFYCCQIEP